MRYRLIPYLYDLFREGTETGLPVIRPLVLHYQDDLNTYELTYQFLVGENILVAPVLQQSQRASRFIYLRASGLIIGQRKSCRETVYYKGGSPGSVSHLYQKGQPGSKLSGDGFY